mgnify:CR=1 FL=1
MHVYFDFKKQGNNLVLGAIIYENETDFTPRYKRIIAVEYDGGNQFEMCLMAFENAVNLVVDSQLTGTIRFYNQNSGVVGWIINSDTCRQEVYQNMIERSLDKLRNMIGIRPMIKALAKSKDNKAKKYCVLATAEKKASNKNDGFQDILLGAKRYNPESGEFSEIFGGIGSPEPQPAPVSQSNPYAQQQKPPATPNNTPYTKPTQQQDQDTSAYDTALNYGVEYNPEPKDYKQAVNGDYLPSNNQSKSDNEEFADNVTNLLPFIKRNQV